MLLPLIESTDEVKCTIVRICMVNGKQFEKELKKSIGSNDWAIEVGNDWVTSDTSNIYWVLVKIIE